MQPQPDLFHPRANRGQHGMQVTDAVHHGVVDVAFELQAYPEHHKQEVKINNKPPPKAVQPGANDPG